MKQRIISVGSAVLVLIIVLGSLSYYDASQEEIFQHTMIDRLLPIVATADNIQYLIQKEQQYISDYYYEKDYMYLQEIQDNNAQLQAAMGTLRSQIAKTKNTSFMLEKPLTTLQTDFSMIQNPVKQMTEVNIYKSSASQVYGETQGLLTAFVVDAGTLSSDTTSLFNSQKTVLGIGLRVTQGILQWGAAFSFVLILLFSYFIFKLLGRLEMKGQIDELTGLYNKRFLREMINTMIDHQQTFAVIMIDLDHFKDVNDTYGHGVGDAVLRQLASVVKKQVRDSDYACRYGGEEFVLLLRTNNLPQLAMVAERIRVAVEDTVFANELKKTCSGGYGLWKVGEAADELLERVDAKLYEAKEAGRNRMLVTES